MLCSRSRPRWGGATGVALALALAASGVARAESLWLEERLPAGRTLLYAEVEPLTDATARVHATEVGKLWTQLQPFVDDLLGGLDAPVGELFAQLEAQLGLKPQDVLEALKGGVAIGVLNTADGGGEPQPAIAIAFSKASAETIRAVVATLSEQAGGDLPPIAVEAGAMTVVTILGAETLLLERGAEGSLEDHAPFQWSRQRAFGGSDEGIHFVWGNTKAVLAMAPPEAKAKLDALGLGGQESLGLGVGVANGRMHEALVGATSGAHTGLLKLLADQAPVDARKLADQVPSDVTGFMALSLDLEKLRTGLLGLVDAVEPEARPEIDDMLAQIEGELGFSVADLCRALGESWVVEAHVPEGGLPLITETVISVNVRDAARIQRILMDLMSMAGFEVKTMTRGNVTVRYGLTPVGQLGEEPFRGMDEQAVGAMVIVSSIARAWTIQGGRLYLSASPRTLVERFERARKSLTETEAFKRAIGNTPPGSRMVAYGRPDRALGPIYHVALTLLSTFEPILRGAGIPLDTALLPGPAAIGGTLGPSTASLDLSEKGFALCFDGGLPVLSSAVVVGALAGAAFTGARPSEPMMPPSAPPEHVLYALLEAQSGYKEKHARYAETFDELFAEELIDPGLVYGSYEYHFVIQESTAETFRIVATPYDPSMPWLEGTPDGVAPIEAPEDR